MTEQLVGGSFTRPTMSPQSYRGEQVVPGNQKRTRPVGMPDPFASDSASSGPSVGSEYHVIIMSSPCAVCRNKDRQAVF